MIPYTFHVSTRQEVKDFIEANHYSHNINGVISDYCFKIVDISGNIVGAMLYGRLAMRNQYKKYVIEEKDIIELRRLVCIDDTPKNTESWFIGNSLRWLKKNTQIMKVVSYSDLMYGHSGVVYKASNFTLIGQSPANKVIKRLEDGKLYHDKTIRTKYKGNLKPFAQKLKDQLLSGEAVYIKTPPKNIYVFTLRDK